MNEFDLVYDYRNEMVNPNWFAVAVFATVVLFFVTIKMRRVIPQKTHVVLIIMCIGSPIALYVFIRVIMNNVDIRSDMDEGKYLIIEGPVENYKLSRGKGPYESFTVQGVEFRYSGSGLEEGYSVTATQGGAIYRNGQYVRIGYYSAGSPNAPFWDNNRILIMQVKNYLRTTD